MKKICSHPMLHNYPVWEADAKCRWCGKTLKEIYEEYITRINDEGVMYIPRGILKP